MLETLLIITALVLMIIGVLLTFVPFLPGPMITWGVGFVFALLTGFDRVGLLALAVMTGLMVVGSTAELWMQLLGVQMQGGSCLATLGSAFGGCLATFVIPIPLIGTVIGMVAGAWLFELARRGELNDAVAAGKNAFWVWLLGSFFEFSSAVLILLVFVFSVYWTA